MIATEILSAFSAVHEGDSIKVIQMLHGALAVPTSIWQLQQPEGDSVMLILAVMGS